MSFMQIFQWPTWDLSAPDGSHVGPMNLAIWVVLDTVMAPLVILPWHLCFPKVTRHIENRYLLFWREPYFLQIYCRETLVIQRKLDILKTDTFHSEVSYVSFKYCQGTFVIYTKSDVFNTNKWAMYPSNILECLLPRPIFFSRISFNRDQKYWKQISENV